jgi:hypothetical protein
MAGTVAGKVVFELDVEEPMHAFDAPMATRRAGDALDVEWRRGDVEPGVEAAAIGIFGARGP